VRHGGQGRRAWRRRSIEIEIDAPLPHQTRPVPSIHAERYASVIAEEACMSRSTVC
jgi:hypothetical protein